MKQSRSTQYPQGVKFLSFTQMWESFSFFGMRALLVLYLISHLHYSAQDAFLLYTLYVALVEVCSSLGGYVADRFLGYKRAVLVGGAFIGIGHLLLTFSFSSSLFFLGLGAIVCGSSLFRVSLQALLGSLYTHQNSNREQGFTLLWIGMNVGGLCAAILCGYVAHLYGWHAGFGLAAFGMLIGMVIFACKMHTLPSLEPSPKTRLFILCALCVLAAIGLSAILHYFAELHSFMLPIGLLVLALLLYRLGKEMTRTLILLLAGAFAALIAYFSAEELWGSLLMVFSEDHINRTFFGIEVPSSIIGAINPLIIITLGPLIARLPLTLPYRIICAFIALSSSFFIFYIAAKLPYPSVLYVLSGLSLMAIGEVLLAPGILAFSSKNAPARSSGLMMGATALAFSMGSLLSADLPHIAVETSSVFGIIACCALGIALLILIRMLMKSQNISRIFSFSQLK